MKRIMIVGGPGSGKSTLARLLGERTGLPVVHMDHIRWQPGWIERARDDEERLIREAHAEEAWISDGTYADSFAARIGRADTLIWLDLPVWLRLWRVLRRTVSNLGKTRPELPDGCPEVIGRQTLEFIAFIWRTRQSGRQGIEAIARSPPSHLTVHHLHSLAEIRVFLGGSAALAAGG